MYFALQSSQESSELSQIIKKCLRLIYPGHYIAALKLIDETRKRKIARNPNTNIYLEFLSGFTFELSSRFKLSWHAYSLAYAEAQQIQDTYLELLAKYHFARLLRQMSNYEKALNLLNEVELACGNNSFEGQEYIMALVTGLQGAIYCYHGKSLPAAYISAEEKRASLKLLNKAELKVNESIDLFHHQKNSLGINEQMMTLGRIWLNRDNYKKGLSFYQTAYDYFQKINFISQYLIAKSGVAAVYANIGDEACRQRNFSKCQQAYSMAMQYFDEVVNEARSINDHRNAAFYQENIAHLYWSVFHNSGLALKNYQKSINELEKVRNQLGGTVEQHEIYFSDLQKVYRRMADLAGEIYQDSQAKGYPEIELNKYIETLFQLTESSKANVLLARILGKISNTNITSKPYKQVLNGLEKMDELLEKSKYFDLKRGGVTRLKDLQQNLNSYQVFISFYAGIKKYHVIFIQKNQIHYSNLPITALAQLFKQYKDDAPAWANNRQVTQMKVFFTELKTVMIKQGIWFFENPQLEYFLSFDTSVGPLATDLLPLEEVPFYLGQNILSSHQLSASIWLQSIKRKHTKNDKYSKLFVGFGKQDYSTPNLGPLKNSLEEIGEIAQILSPAGQVKLYKDEESNFTNFSLASQNARIVHLACHAVIEQQISSLVLSQGGKDFFLEMDQIFSMEISAELIVLSACHTTGGKTLQGEGISSLARAFIGAGAKCVVCSLWPVTGALTRLIMPLFYHGLFEGKTSGKALFDAKKEYVKTSRFPLPIDWGAFIIIGDTNFRI